MSFPHVDELDKAFGPDRVTRGTSKNFEEVVIGLQNKTIELDKDEENDEEEDEGEFLQSTPPTSKVLKKVRKEPTPMGKGKKKRS